MKHGDKPVFQPRNVSDLRPEVQLLAGKQLTVQGVSWLIQEDDETPYTGERAITVKESPYWIPSGDLRM